MATHDDASNGTSSGNKPETVMAWDVPTRLFHWSLVTLIALAWVSKHAAVTAPIVGATKPEHLTDAIASLDITLTADELRDLESPYTPQPVQGHL